MSTPRPRRSRKARAAFVPNEPPRGRDQTNEGAIFTDDRETAASELWMTLRKTWRRGSSKVHDWTFFPGSLSHLTKTQITKYGTKGYHYADGWNGLMDMVDHYGENHAPTLRIPGNESSTTTTTTTSVPAAASAASRTATTTPRVSMSPVNSEAEAQQNVTGADNQDREGDQQGSRDVKREEEEDDEEEEMAEATEIDGGGDADNGDDEESVEPMELEEYHKILDCMEKLSNQLKFLERTSVYTAAEKAARTELLKKQLDNCYTQLDQMVV